VPASCSRGANGGTIDNIGLWNLQEGFFVPIHTRRSRVAWLFVALVALVVPATFAVSTSAAGAASSNTLTVKAGEYTYILSGKPKAGWVQFNFDNTGVEDHMMAVFKLKKGTKPAQLKQAIASSDDSAFNAIADTSTGDPTLAGTPALLGPKQKTTTFTKVPAGTYGIVCFVTAPDGSPHAAHGMYKIFTVKGKSSTKPPTDGVADVSLSDTSITVPPGNAPKNLTVKVTNTGTKAHDFQLVKLADGKTIDEAKAYFDQLISTGKAPAGDAPGALVGGVEGVAPNGGVAYVEWTLPAGHYGYVSTEGDAPNDDYTAGLHGTFTIS
jgi:hypothetical protein